MQNSPIRLQGFSWRALNTDWQIYAPWTSVELARGMAYWQTSIVNQVEQFEQMASRFRENSELQRWMNSPIQQTVQLSPILHQLLIDSMDYMKKTNGHFNMLLGNELSRAGYNKSFEKITEPTPIPSHPTFRFTGPDEQAVIECLSFEQRSWRRNSDCSIDFGGIGKGWIADQVAQRLQASWSLPYGVVDAGGDIRVWSTSPTHCFPIEIMHPFQEETQIAEFEIQNGAVATSSKMKRRWKDAAGNWQHHLIDSQNGAPSRSPVVQASVFTETVTEADVLAKCVCILDPEHSAALLHSFPAVRQAWIVLEDQRTFEWQRSEGDPTWKILNT